MSELKAGNERTTCHKAQGFLLHNIQSKYNFRRTYLGYKGNSANKMLSLRQLTIEFKANLSMKW